MRQITGKRGKRLLGVAVGALSVALVAGACGSSGGGSGTGGGENKLTVVNASGAEWVCNYNPFNPAANVDTNLLYEPLIVINSLDGKETPWLATGYKWSDDKKTLTLDIRKGVKWTDGKPFTAEDVAFNFNLQKKHAELDNSALWSGGILDTVTAKGDQVIFTFKRVSTTALRYIVDGTRMRPKHIWDGVADPAKEEVKDPKKAIGTGPYTIKTCNTQTIIFEKNKNFWQKGKPKVDQIVYPAFKDNPPANRHLQQGRGDWGGQFIPQIDSYWVSKDKENRKYWYPAVSNVAVTVNVTNPLFKDKRVRQALAYAIDRNKVSEKGMQGYQKPASQTLIVDSFEKWRNEEAAAKYDYKYDCAKADTLLKSAGFAKGSDGKYTAPGGKPFKPELINNAGFTDWVASTQFVGESAKACGIDLQVVNLEGSQFDDRRDKGQFDLAYDSVSSGPTPYYELRNFLYGKGLQPVGTRTSTNRGRYNNPAFDQLIESYDQTVDENQQIDLVKKMQEIVLEDVPVIPVTQNVSWAQFDSTRFTGWPSAENPYANPAPYSANWEVVLLNLEPVKK